MTYASPRARLNAAILNNDAQQIAEIARTHPDALRHGAQGHLRDAAYTNRAGAFAALSYHFKRPFKGKGIFKEDVKWGQHWLAAIRGKAMALDRIEPDDDHPLSCAIIRGDSEQGLVMLNAAYDAAAAYPFFRLACGEDANWFVRALSDRNLLPDTPSLLCAAAQSNSLDCLTTLLANSPRAEQLVEGLESAATMDMPDAVQLIVEQMLAKGVAPGINDAWSHVCRERATTLMLQHSLCDRLAGATAEDTLGYESSAYSL